MARKVWNDHTYEGILIRKIIRSLEKHLKDADLDEKLRILNAVHQASTAKLKIDAHIQLDAKCALIMKLYNEQKLNRVTNHYARELKAE